MRKLLFLLPGTTQQFFAGGLTAELKTMAIAQQICPAEIVTYRNREPNTPFLDDVLANAQYRDCIFIISWGFDVPKLVQRLSNRFAVYHAHSTRYGFRLPPRVPIVTVSKNSMGYWGEMALSSPIYHLPNEISADFENRRLERDVDVLVQARKSSEYLLQQLVPALQKRCNVVLLDSYVDDLVGLFNRSKIYLYDSAEYWGRFRLTEGFGLPPLEAMACGCQVFSSVNHALADYLDPGFNCQKISSYSTEYDVQRITKTLKTWQSIQLPDDFFTPYRTESLVLRLRTILQEINDFFDYLPNAQTDIPQLTRRRIAYLTIKRLINKIKRQ